MSTVATARPVTDDDDVDVDGRHLRRSRNREKVIDAVLELWAEGLELPEVDAIAERSGVSMRSIYRYFEDQDGLIEATIAKARRTYEPLADIPGLGEGSLAERIDHLVDARLRLFAAIRPFYRSTVRHAARLAPIRAHLATVRADLRAQVLAQLAPELGALPRSEREALATACDLLTQMDALERCTGDLGLSDRATAAHLRAALTALLS